MKQYKVWVSVEEMDMDNEDETIDVCETQCLGTFDTCDEALEFAGDLPHKENNELWTTSSPH